jgi:hypothetical protein
MAMKIQMRTPMWKFPFIAIAFALAIGFSQGPVHASTNCAFQDVNDSGALDGGDVAVPDSAWQSGTPYVSAFPFVVPAGCNYLFASGVVTLKGIQVTAPKITINGSIHIAKPGGLGIELVASGDFISNGGVLKSGGLDPTYAPSKKRSVMVVSQTGSCTFKNATLEGVSPVQQTNVGVLCHGDVVARGSKFIGALVNIQSLTGKIDAGTSPTPNACTCTPDLPSQFVSLNDPAILIAYQDLILDGSEVNGRYRVLLVSEKGTVSTVNSQVLNGVNPPGGAHTAVFASPASVNRAQVDFEDVVGPSSGVIDIAQACYESLQKVRHGGSVQGTPDPAACRQFPTDFNAVVSQSY